jgi:hypothetical protein
MNGTEITLYDRIENPLEAVEKLGKVFAKSGMFGCEKEEQGQLLALACMATKKDPFQFLDENHLINGRRSMRADRMLANYRARGGKVTWKQFDDKAAVGVWAFDGNTTEIGFTYAEAEKAGLIRPKSAWTTFPAEMLRARCISRAVRMLCPEAIAGAYLPDEKAIDIEATVQAQEQKTGLFQEPAGPASLVQLDRDTTKPASEKVIEAEVVPEPATQPESPKVTGDYMDFMKLIKGREEEVFNWAVAKGKIKPDQKLSDLPQGIIKGTCANPSKLWRSIANKSTEAAK